MVLIQSFCWLWQAFDVFESPEIIRKHDIFNPVTKCTLIITNTFWISNKIAKWGIWKPNCFMVKSMSFLDYLLWLIHNRMNTTCLTRAPSTKQIILCVYVIKYHALVAFNFQNMFLVQWTLTCSLFYNLMHW